ncbi:hypothetical protein AvCA_09130 [Azotobacter vinelandii CA]|uniref:Uncharacterized protein n=2 Tax=Azotobacter vinelandii TaxID=354 RepID=C1DMX2_AZOVD|nr:hypothetical protein Avin_09130 [Azotobacter vinelandii DJ]AGK15470.1 hypothetical protein AvCA_09130 [Azotobacter vinelandii CA]AGK19592.1 hypothetical protein AvCA6_09130 [Azotobacter vinelandii CA6]
MTLSSLSTWLSFPLFTLCFSPPFRLPHRLRRRERQ